MTTGVPIPKDRNTNVLVVDDDGPILRALQARLKHAGYGVETARDGINALQCAEGAKPAVAVLDINMPGLDGFSVAEKLRKALPEIGLVFLTASKAADVRERASALGGAFVEKPFDSKHLMEKINDVCG